MFLEPIKINTRNDYEMAKGFGFEPLVDNRFELEHTLRVSIQKELFPDHTPESNEKFYKFCWAHKKHVCEECMKPLKSYSAVHVSHILTRGAYPEMAHDFRNVNILCLDCHNRWENDDRENMRIYGVNEFTIEHLKKEYK